MIYEISPISKPRMTRSDKWKKRPCVMQYRAFKDECRLKKVALPDGGFHVHFVLPMPESWSQKRKFETCGSQHDGKPDLDNLVKALFDALYGDDAHLSDFTATKWWGYCGSMAIYPREKSTFPVAFSAESLAGAVEV